MAGPDNQSTRQLFIPIGEAPSVYAPSNIAQQIINFETTIRSTLATVRGPTVYEPTRGATIPSAVFDEMHGVFHASLVGGVADILLVRSGDKLFRHAGWQRGWEQIYSGLTSDTRPGYPDQFLVLNDKVIWTNGIDYPLIIDAQGRTVPIGFQEVPSPPSVYGPQQLPDKNTFYPNAGGYSWRGDVGTPGDVLNGTQGAVLDGNWFYYVQLEDIYGNLSAASGPSNPALIRTTQASPYNPNDPTAVATGATIDDLTRQFMVRMTAQGPDHTVAVNLYRTPDTVRASTKPRLLARFAGRESFIFGDRRADSDLGPEMERIAPVTVFRTMCAHQGCLIAANMLVDPGLVRRSSPGFPGTWPEDDFVYPDSNGAEVTAVASHAGFLLAFTENAIYDITPDRQSGKLSGSVTLAMGVGCVAPRSVKALADGRLIWLARDGFYTMDASQRITRVSQPIQALTRTGLNMARYRKAVSVVDARSLEYRCAVAPAGVQRNTLLFIFDGENWRRQELGSGDAASTLWIADMCRTDDYRQYILMAARDPTKTRTVVSPQGPTLIIPAGYDVYVADHETTAYEPLPRKATYRSAWIKADETGMTPVHVRSIYLGMMDGFNGNFTVRYYRNGSWNPVIEITDVLAIGVDDGSSIVTDIAGAAIVGSSKAHEPRLVWRMVPAGLENVYAWAFEIEVTYPIRLELAAFAFDQSAAGSGNLRGRIPLRQDR
jgi:hypothetical protein